MQHFAFLTLSLLMLIAPGCGDRGNSAETYSGVAPSDPRLAEFSDMLSVDRASLGLPLLPQQVSFRVERTGGGATT